MTLDIKTLLSIYNIEYATEHKFHTERRWRFDFVIIPLENKIAIEYEGGTWTKGRHTRPSGYARDCEKYNAAVCDGWKVLRYTADMLQKEPEKVVRQILKLMEVSNVYN